MKHLLLGYALGILTITNAEASLIIVGAMIVYCTFMGMIYDEH